MLNAVKNLCGDLRLQYSGMCRLGASVVVSTPAGRRRPGKVMLIWSDNRYGVLFKALSGEENETFPMDIEAKDVMGRKAELYASSSDEDEFVPPMAGSSS